MNREIFGLFLDFLIPPFKDTSIGGSYTWHYSLDRNELEQEVINVLKMECIVDIPDFNTFMLRFKSSHPELFRDLTEALLGDFFTHPEVKTRLRQAIPAPFPRGYTLPKTDWSILEQSFLRHYDYRRNEIGE